jgi:hypothetical protein
MVGRAGDPPDSGIAKSRRWKVIKLYWQDSALGARSGCVLAFLGNPLISLENPWKILGIVWKVLGFSLELTLISFSETSLFKGLRGPLGAFFVSAHSPA